MTKSASVLSVFSGLGGLDIGLEAAGFDCVGCIEIDDTARRSLKVNRPEWHQIEPGDVLLAARDLKPKDLGLKVGELTLLAGAPPCQPYSKAAMWAPDAWNGLADERAQPLHSFLSLVDRFQPAAVVMENVSGFARGRHSAVPTILSALARINERHKTSYWLDVQHLWANEYGVPQKRQRAILVALRDGGTLTWPEATHRDEPCRAWDALAEIDDDEPAPRPTGRWAELLPSIPEGWNYLWHTNRGGGLPLFGYRTRYWSFLLKLAKDQPSWTIPAQPGPSVGPFHWDSRPLRTSELLRLQTFPADWVVEGARREQVKQVGNATPPLLAELVGRSVAQAVGAQPAVGAPIHGVPRRDDLPPATIPADVPSQYARMAGEHPDHRGTGRGPMPRGS